MRLKTLSSDWKVGQNSRVFIEIFFFPPRSIYCLVCLFFRRKKRSDVEWVIIKVNLDLLSCRYLLHIYVARLHKFWCSADFTALKKENFTPNWNVIHIALNFMAVEALVVISKLHNPSGVSWREGIPASPDTMEACGGHVYKHKQPTKIRHNTPSYCSWIFWLKPWC